MIIYFNSNESKLLDSFHPHVIVVEVVVVVIVVCSSVHNYSFIIK